MASGFDITETEQTEWEVSVRVRRYAEQRHYTLGGLLFHWFDTFRHMWRLIDLGPKLRQ